MYNCAKMVKSESEICCHLKGVSVSNQVECQRAEHMNEACSYFIVVMETR